MCVDHIFEGITMTAFRHDPTGGRRCARCRGLGGHECLFVPVVIGNIQSHLVGFTGAAQIGAEEGGFVPRDAHYEIALVFVHRP